MLVLQKLAGMFRSPWRNRVFWVVLALSLVVGAVPVWAQSQAGGSTFIGATDGIMVSIGCHLGLMNDSQDGDLIQQMGQEALDESVESGTPNQTSNLAGTAACDYERNTPVMAQLNRAVASLYNRPASSLEYYAYVKHNAGLGGTAYAQSLGTGFRGLSSLLPLWRVFRNVAYALIILVFLFVGFAIMFRVKLNPQTVMTVQNMIPSLIATLLAVTFSYAIAGFLIDLMYVLMYLVVQLFATAGVINDAGELMRMVYSHSLVSTGLWGIWGNSLDALGQSLSEILDLVLGQVFASVGSFLLKLVFGLMLMVAIIRTLIAMIDSYIRVIFHVIFGPLEILLGVMPGGIGLFGWIKNIAANLIVFPAVLILIIIAALFSGLNAEQHCLVPSYCNPLGVNTDIVADMEQGGGWMPPLISTDDRTGNLNQNQRTPGALTGLIGFFILLGMPKYIKAIKKAMKEVEAPGVGGAVGKAIGGAGAAIMTPLQMGYQANMTYQGYKAAKGWWNSRGGGGGGGAGGGH